ncbi:MAG: DnaJ domain-containing protein [Spirochaetales bacterium]|nr:DnaJ domain-containing protein [Spirochaetales bacterium]
MAVNEEFKVNFYELLGIDTNAGLEEIKKAYRRLSKLHHPDLTGEEISEIQLLLNEARDVLCDEEARSRHDEYWAQVNERYEEGEELDSFEVRGKVEPAGPAPPNYSRVQEILRKRLAKALEEAEEALRAGLKARRGATYKRLLKEQRQPRFNGFLFLALTLGCLVSGFFFMPFFVLAIVPLGLFIARIRDAMNSEEIAIFGPFRKQRLREQAGVISRSTLNQELRRLESYYEKLDFIMKLLRRQERVGQADKLLFSKLAICFYMLDFRPVSYEAKKAVMIFRDQERQYFIHGFSLYKEAVDVGYVKSLIRSMKRRGISQGFLFSLSGVSAVARTFAQFNHLQVYCREEILHWLAQATLSRLPGLDTNIIGGLDELWAFLKKITLETPSEKP